MGGFPMELMAPLPPAAEGGETVTIEPGNRATLRNREILSERFRIDAFLGRAGYNTLVSTRPSQIVRSIGNSALS